jgi:FAD/FMN-containing dehydrogenase
MILPAAAAYDRARRVWNAAVDRRPAGIARCGSAQEVVAALEQARAEGLPVSVRGGGHSIAGHGVVEGGVMIDLGRMRGVTIDGDVLTAGGGALWSDVLARTAPLGVATPGGFDPRVGVAGLTLGGGYGMLSRLRGMACDHLVGADVVLADGTLRRAEDDPDLLWALRGAGANFGVVTALRLRVAPVPQVLVGLFAYPHDQLAALLPLFHELTTGYPDETTAYLGAFQGHILVTAFHFGDATEGAQRYKPFRRFGPPFHIAVAQRAYAELHVADDETFPDEHHHHWRARFLADLDDRPAFAEVVRRAAELGVYVCVEHLGGEMGRVAPDATAFAHRAARYGLAIAAKWKPPDDPAAAVAAADEVHAAAASRATGAYVNYMAAGAEDAAVAYGDNLPRLRELKRRYDPENVFRSNVNITA